MSTFSGWLIAKATIPSICSYKLQLYLAVIKSFVQIHEQQKQLLQNKNLINLGTWAALAGGILAALEVISLIIEWIRNFQGYSFL